MIREPRERVAASKEWPFLRPDQSFLPRTVLSYIARYNPNYRAPLAEALSGTVMTKIADLLTLNRSAELNREGEEGDFEELAGYVVTDRIKGEYEVLFSAMAAALKSPDENVGIWVSGPPGSGKSSFVRNLGCVLSNRNLHGIPASTIFLKNLESQRLGEHVALINRLPYEIFWVQLGAELAVETHAEHIAEAMYRSLLRHLDYAEDFDISELEMELEKEDKLASFQDLCRAEYEHEWREVRASSQNFERTSPLAHRLAPKTYPSADAWLKAIQARPSRRPSVKDLVERAFDLCRVRRHGKPFAFLVDEIGPYGSLGPQRIENLRAIVEGFGRESLQRLKAGKSPGPTWIVVAAQETLPEVSKHLAASRITGNQLHDQFKHRVALTPGDMREVLARGVLHKKESHEPVLRKLFRESALAQSVEVERRSRQPQLDEDQCVRFYPYLPHLIDLSMEIIAGIRLNPDLLGQLRANNLSVIQLCVDMLWSGTRLADQPLGTLVSIDQMYAPLEANLPPAKRKKMRELRQRIENHEDRSGLAGRVLEAICLLEFVNADLPRTAHNIAALLIRNVSEAPPVSAVTQILRELNEGQLVCQTEGGWALYDFDALRRRAAALKNLRDAVGAVNPRLPGWRNDMIQAVKKLLARFLGWYTRPLYEFDAALSRSLEEVVWAVDHLTTSLTALDALSQRRAFEHLAVDLDELEEQLAQVEKKGAPVAEPVQARAALLHQQVKVLAGMQKTANLPDSPAASQGWSNASHNAPWQGIEANTKTTYITGLFGTGRRYINELILKNIGERAKNFRDTIRLHPGPTPMIYSGHVTAKYPSRSQETPVIMRYILESVESGFSDLIFIYRHPLDSLLTNWIWWRTYLRDNRQISGISEVYKDAGDLCADLENHFVELESFAAGDPEFFASSPGPRFLSFPEFVEETEIQIQSATLALRLEDCMADPLPQFSKITELMAVPVDLERISLAPPRTKPYGHLAVQERVPRFRSFVDGMDAQTKARIEKIGYRLRD